jgi:acyl-CoA hydrolase
MPVRPALARALGVEATRLDKSWETGMTWADAYRDRRASAAEAVQRVRSGDRLTMSSNAGAPRTLLEALCARSGELRDVEIAALLTLGEAPYDRPEHRAAFRANALFVGANLRHRGQRGARRLHAVFLSEIPRLFAQQLPIDVALVQVSPPDDHGFCSFGVSVDVIKAAALGARELIAR